MAENRFPSMTALLGLLAIAGYQHRDKIAELLKGAVGGGATAAPGADANAQAGATSGTPTGAGLGGLLAGAGATEVGSLLHGGLSELVDRFKQAGQGRVADSWVGSGANESVSHDQISDVLGADVMQALAERTGLAPDEVARRLASALPNAVDRYTPEGRVPTADRLAD